MSRNICATKKAQQQTGQKQKKAYRTELQQSRQEKDIKPSCRFFIKKKNLTPYTHFSYSEKVEKVGIVWQSVTKILDAHKQRHKRKKSLEAKLFPNTEHCLWATRLCPKSERLCEKVRERVTSLQSRVHFVLPQHPPVKTRTQTGLSESRKTRAETCFVAGRRERSGRGPARLSPTLKPRGPSGLCELCAGAC